MLNKRTYRIAALAALLLLPVFAAGPTFVPDTTFKGSTLTGWHVLGQADWKAQNGEIVGTPKAGGDGGWLVLDRSYQDVGFYALFRCTGGCRTGVLVRAEKTADGLKGIFVSLNEGDVASYRVTLGADGKELQREALRPGGGGIRIAPPLDPNAPARTARGGRGGRGNAPAQPSDLPITAPNREYRPGDWNQVEFYIDANVIRGFLNDANLEGGVAEDEAGRYGPVALYVGGAGEVRFKNIAYRDMAMRVMPKEQVSSRFRMQRLNEFYYAWSEAAADFNRDGNLDIVAGPYIYYGPDFTKSREILMAHTWNPSREYANDCMLQYAADMTGDGWPDVICSNLGTPVFLYVNPKGESRRWDKYQVIPRISTEIMDFKDIDGDGKPELLYVADGVMRYAKPDPAKPTDPWIVRTISERGYTTGHGIGVGDINGDGRQDIVGAYGWWEQPAAGSKQELWSYHPQVFGTWSRCCGVGGALIGVYDVNGDGLNDIVTSMEAHGFGLGWYEQKRDAAGKISFVEHVISGDRSVKNPGGVTFSQPHGTYFADVDGDGVQDLIVGKRYWSHLDNLGDPDPYGAPVLYWYRTVRNPKAPGGAEFVPELIHNHSGAGSELLAVDLNKDGAMDIVTATDRGTFIFWGKPPAGAAKKAPAPAGK
jgi:hypothetical protein